MIGNHRHDEEALPISPSSPLPFWLLMGTAWIAADQVPSSAEANAIDRLRVEPGQHHIELTWQTQSVVPKTSQSDPLYPDYIIYHADSINQWHRLTRFYSSKVSGRSKRFSITLPKDDQGFFKAKIKVALPFEDLSSRNLVRGNLSGANLHAAKLRQTRLDYADLTGANLTEADLREASFFEADLTATDLTGARLDGTELSRARFDQTIMPDGSTRTIDVEARLLAMETESALLPDDELSKTISSDLAAIREAFPKMRSIRNRLPWKAGELLIQPTAKGRERMEAGGFPGSSELNAKYKPYRIEDESESFSRILFKKRYNPEVLARDYQEDDGISKAEPNLLAGDGDDITVNPSQRRYTFFRRWGDCPAGCINAHIWQFAVSDDGSVRVIEERGNPIPRN